MISPVTLAEIGALLGDVARAKILSALMNGRALTAGELAWAAGITAQTASGHLAKLTEARLIVRNQQGRHRYYRLASPLVAQMLETVMAVAAVQSPPRHRPPARIDAALRAARTCYDHLAGRLGVALADALVEQDFVELSESGGVVTASGRRFLVDFGLNIDALAAKRRCFCKPCLDWSERRVHLAGAVGAELAARCFSLGWVERQKDSRAVTITESGCMGFASVFGIECTAA